MILVCVNPFGNFVPGDEVLVPDDAVFDTAFFAAKGGETSTGDETPKGDESADDKEND